MCAFPLLGEILLSDTEMFSPHGLWRSSGSNGGQDSGREHTHVNEDIVLLSLIKMFPQGWSIQGTNKKNVITDVIKRCVMIHDNNCARGR